jgi:biopolymer transport protein ExbB
MTMVRSRTVKYVIAALLGLATALWLAAPAIAQTPPDAVLNLPRDLSPWGMFMAADIVVKAVMVGLAFASVLTWTIWLAKAIELLSARRHLNTAIVALGQARTFDEALTAMR